MTNLEMDTRERHLCKQVNKTAISRFRSIAVKLSNTARRRILLGSHSHEPSRNLSVFTSRIIFLLPYYIKNILDLEK